ncbi:hypothetical protein ABEX47_13125 [Paenibacillus ehimensis]|uniref:hypothetical protein n=1 Tax=Paenibacillus ehimensis TaxID=79264 RepID=UPI003D2A3B6F
MSDIFNEFDSIELYPSLLKLDQMIQENPITINIVWNILTTHFQEFRNISLAYQINEILGEKIGDAIEYSINNDLHTIKLINEIELVNKSFFIAIIKSFKEKMIEFNMRQLNPNMLVKLSVSSGYTENLHLFRADGNTFDIMVNDSTYRYMILRLIKEYESRAEIEKDDSEIQVKYDEFLRELFNMVNSMHSKRFAVGVFNEG